MGLRLPLILRAATEFTARMPARAAFAAIGIHFVSSWAGYGLLGEPLAGSPTDMIYNYVVTGSSVGYGDLAPQSAAGRLFAAFWVIPGALAGFAWMIGKVIQIIATSARNKMTGAADYAHRTGHVLIIGHVPGETAALIRETPPGREGTVLVSPESLEGRVPEGVDWVFSPDLADAANLRRAGVEGAGKVLVMTGNDDATLAVCLALCGGWPGKRVVALFREARKAALLNGNCPSVETVVSPAASLLARASDGPGTASVVERLLALGVDDTLDHAVWTGPETTVKEVAAAMAAQRCLLVAVGGSDGKPDLVPDENAVVRQGGNVYYIGKSSFAEFSPAGGVA